jgi:CubicO group peptidase (beta-lactamase class C family)
MGRRTHRWGGALAAAALAVGSAAPAYAQSRPASSVAAPAATGFDPARLDRLDALLKSTVDEGRVTGLVTRLGRHGRTVDVNVYGRKSAATGAPMTEDTIFRIYSMSKPVTGVAMMILFEEGKWRLDDPISKHVPEFANLKVLKGVGPDGKPVLEDLRRQPTMRELMTHTAGFGYGLGGTDPVNAAFREKQVLGSQGLQQMIDKVAGIPLLAQPGEAWRYSIAVDIQGYVVEKLSGQSLDVFMAERIFKPLRMTDTGFQVPPEKLSRFAALYAPNPQAAGALVEASGPMVQDYTQPPRMVSGGGGLVSTAADYARFCQMILNGGELDGARILAPATVELMSADHLPAGVGVTTDGQGTAAGVQSGVGFGLGFAVITDPAKAGVLAGKGTLSWGGAAGTWFWIDPKNALYYVGMLQRFGGGLGLRERSSTLVYGALVQPER